MSASEMTTGQVEIGGERLYVTAHAVSRYLERVKPTLIYRQASAELGRVLPHAVLLAEMPEWVRRQPEDPDAAVADVWVVLSDAIAFPVTDGRLATCIVRGLPSPARRARKRYDRQSRAYKRTVINGGHGRSSARRVAEIARERGRKGEEL